MDETFEGSMRKYALATKDRDYDHTECCRRVIVHFVDNALVPWGAYIVKVRLS